jgi:pyruvate dehydrogenase E2 component (dihydrolipoamide acetyltransferase)
MAHWEFKLPDLGEGVAEGEIVAWLVKPGDTIDDDQPMVEVMTDKATVTITSPRKGRILETRGKVGDIVRVHAVLVVYDLAEAATAEGQAKQEPAPVAAQAAEAKGSAATAVGDIRETLPGMGTGARVGAPGAGRGEAPRAAGSEGAAYFKDKPLATPATRKVARELEVDLRKVSPSGPQGRVTSDDVRAFVGRPGAKAAGRAPVAPSGREERVPLAGMRRRIAQKMAQSTRTAAHFTFVEECDVTRLQALRARLKQPAADRGVALTYLPFIVKAVAAALQRHPVLNSTLDESTSEIVYRRYYNIGVAVSTDAGLMVPVVKDADRRGLLDVAREVDRLATDARAGKSKVEDLTGSTFTITSLGAQGGLFATPIINFPDVGILGVHRIKERPVVLEGRVAIGQVMLLSLSFDHRIVDGHVGAAFAYDVIGLLEDPDQLLLETG